MENKPLVAAAPEEVANLLQQGLISEDQANEYYLKHKISNDFYGMPPEEVEEAYNRKLITDADVNRYCDRKENPIWFFTKDLARGAAYGVQSGIEEMAQATNSLYNAIAPAFMGVDPEPKIGLVDEPSTLPGQLVGGVSQAMTGFIPATGALSNLTKIEKFAELSTKWPAAYKFVEGIVAGMVGDSVSFDPYDGRLSNMIEEHPSLRNPITGFLKADPGDPEAEARLKNALEGAYLGGAFELVFAGLKGIKGKLWANKADVAEEVAKEVDSLVPDHVRSGTELDEEEIRKAYDTVERQKAEDAVAQEKPKEEVVLTPEKKIDMAQKFMKLMRGEDNIDVHDLYDNPAGPFNLEKFETVEETYKSFQLFSNELSEIQKKMTGGKQTLDEMALEGTKLDVKALKKAEGNMAKYLGTSINELRAHYEGVKDGAAKMMRDMQFLEGYSRFVTQFAKNAKTDVEKLQAVEHIYRLAEAQMLVKGIQSHTARALSSLQNMRRSRIPFSALNEADIAALAAEYPALNKVVREAAKIKDPGAMMNFANKTIRAKVLDGVLEWRQAALLSSLGTHTVNIFGTAAGTLLKAWEHSSAIGVRALAEGDLSRLRQIQKFGLGMAQGLLDAFKLNSPAAKALLVKDAINEKGFFGGMRYSYDKFLQSNDVGTVWKALLSGESQLDFQTKFSHGPAIPNWALGPIWRIPFHVLTAEDEFFKSISYWGSMYSQAFEAGRSLGKKGKDLDEFIKLFVGKPGDEAHLKALTEAREATFSESLGPEGALGKISAGINRMTWAKILFVPFWKIGVNIMKFAVRRTPLSLLSESTRKSLMAGGQEGVETMMKIATGSALLGFASWLYGNGIITGAAPKGQEDAWRNANVGENSILVGGKWIEYTRLEPLSLLFRVAADVTRLIENYELPEDERDSLIVGGIHIIQNLLSDSYMRSLSELIEAMTNEDFPFAKWLNRQAATFAPFSAGMAQHNRSKDPTVRDVPTTIGFHELWDSFMSAYDPSRLLPKRDAIYGTPIERDPRLLAALNQYIPDDPVTVEMALIGLNMKAPSRTRVVGGVKVKLTDEQYDQFMQEVAKFPIKETLQRIINDPEYQAIQDRNVRANLLRSTISQFRDAAWNIYLSKDDSLRNKFIQKIEKRARAAMGIENNLSATEQMKRLREVLQDV